MAKKKVKREVQPKTILLNSLVKELCRVEVGKKQLDAGQAREVIKKLALLIVDDYENNTFFRKTLNKYIDEIFYEKGLKK